jgi:PAS domain S-box-containing protein
MFDDIIMLSILLTLIPACLNLFILGYIVKNLPKNRMTNVFSLFLLALVSWQIQETIFRMNISPEFANLIDRVFSLGWLAIGSLVFHFAALYSKSRITHSRWFYFLVYGPYMILFSIYHSNYTPLNLNKDDFWGYMVGIRPGSTDLLQRYWVALLAIMALILLFRFAFKQIKGSYKRGQALIIAFGLLIPTVQGIMTQVLFPIFGLKEIPLTTAFLTFISISTVIALNRYRLFDMSESIEVERLLDELASFVFFVTPKRQIVYLNPTAEKLFFGTERRNIPIPLKEIFRSDPASYNDFCDAVFNHPTLEKSTSNLESTFLNHEMNPIHVLIASQAIFYNGKLQGFLIMANDITERIMLEEKIKLSNERYNFVTKATKEAIWDLDIPNGKIYWGDAYSKIFGHEIQAGVSSISHWEDNIHPKDRGLVINTLNSFLENEKQHKWEMEYRYGKSNGKYTDVIDKGYIVRDPEGKATRMIGAIQDISKVKSYIKKIEVQNHKLNENCLATISCSPSSVVQNNGTCDCIGRSKLKSG